MAVLSVEEVGFDDDVEDNDDNEDDDGSGPNGSELVISEMTQSHSRGKLESDS
jgi:hypothetical protein